MPSIAQLREYPLFADLNEKELASLASSIVKRSFARGAYIYHPGAPGLNMYLVESGLVRMFFVNHRWEEFLMNLLTPPGCFGLPLLPDNQVRIVGAAALRDTVVLSLSRDVVFDAMRRSPQFAFNIYLEMSNGVRALGKYVHGVATLSVLGRLASVILFLSERDSLGKKNEIDLPITQGDLASLIGSSRGRVNRALAILEEQALIRVEEQKICILDRPGLVAASEV